MFSITASNANDAFRWMLTLFLHYTTSVSNIVEAHWFFGDTQVAKEHLEMLADLGVQSCYAILKYETGDVLLLCTDGEDTYYSNKWEEATCDRAKDSSSDLMGVLDDIANAGGVVQK